NCFAFEDHKSSGLSPVRHKSGNFFSVFNNIEGSAFLMNSKSLVDSIILKRAYHFQSCAVANVSETRITMSSEISLRNISIFRSVEHSAPFFQFAHTIGCLLRMKFCHAPLVQKFSSAHCVAEMNLPVVTCIDISKRCCH